MPHDGRVLVVGAGGGLELTYLAERHAGWAALVVAGSDTPAEVWDESISTLMFDLGWRDSRNNYGPPPADSPTLDVLRLLAGATRNHWRPLGVNAAVAASARAATRP